MQAFAFLNVDHPAVAWAVARGMMVSADQAAAMPGSISFMQAGMIEYENNARIYNEGILEVVRATCFPYQISRMRGLYFFRTKEEAEGRIGDPEWPPYFQPGNLVEFQLYPAAPPTVVDANWITDAPRSKSSGRVIGDLGWIWRYWRGEPSNAPVWEVVANGVAVVCDERIRRKAYEHAEDFFPASHISLLMARLAGEVGTRGGMIFPFLHRQDDKRVQLGYLWSDAEFHDPAVIAQIGRHPDAGVLHSLMSENAEWKAPDFRPWMRTYRLGMQTGVGSAIIPSVHHA